MSDHATSTDRRGSVSPWEDPEKCLQAMSSLVDYVIGPGTKASTLSWRLTRTTVVVRRTQYSGAVTGTPRDDPEKDREERILDAVLNLLAQHGIAGVSIRAVAREAGVAVGLIGYYYDDKVGLIGAALRRIEAQDVDLVAPDPATEPHDRLLEALRRVADPQFLTTEYLSLRLQLWALARAHEEFASINATAQERYRAGLARLIHAARPELTRRDCAKRAADIDVIQNGMWLTALLGLDAASLRRSVARCEEIALSP